MGLSKTSLTLRCVNADGFGNQNNDGIVYFEEHAGRFYAGTANKVDGLGLYSSSDGESWIPAAHMGCGNKKNIAVIKLRSWRGYLYLGAWNIVQGGELWRSANPEEPDSWELVGDHGFEKNVNNQAVGAIRSFGDYLYIGFFNPFQGPQIWRSPDGSPGSFTKVLTGTDLPKETTDASILFVWKNYMYLGCESAIPQLYFNEEYMGRRTNGCTVWRTPGPDSKGNEQWELASTAGFGDERNLNAFRLAELNGNLYCGTWTRPGSISASVYRKNRSINDESLSWDKVTPDGFGHSALDTLLGLEVVNNRLYAGGLSNLRMQILSGMVKDKDDFISGAPHGWLWSTDDGNNWDKHTTPEFLTKQSCVGIHSLGTFNGRLFIGTQHHKAPSELWVLE